MVYGCKENVNDASNDTNLVVSKDYLKPLGGDPRGQFIPNSPFAFIFTSDDSLRVSEGEGKLNIEGENSTSGNYELLLTSRIKTKYMSDLYTDYTYSDTVKGIWRVEGVNISFTVNGFTRTSSFSCTSQDII